MANYPIIEKIHSSDDYRKLTKAELELLPGEIGGDGYLLFALAVKLPGDHVRHVYIAYKLAAFHYGKLHGNYARPELFIYFSHSLCEVRIFAIHKELCAYDAVKQNIDSILSPNRGQEQDKAL